MVTHAEGVSSKTSVGTQVCFRDPVVHGAAMPLSKEANDNLAPKEVSPPKASGVGPLAPPSGPKEGTSQTTSSKELERTPSVSNRPSGRGRALPTHASTSSRKPGQLDKVHSPTSQQSPAYEVMDESMPPFVDDLVP